MSLEICIPSYARPAHLKATVAKLLPQLREGVSLRIIDNCSPEPITLEGLMISGGAGVISIARNLVNIGGNANITRCFETCDKEYMWLLGDDDLVTENAVDTILQMLGGRPGVSYINFCLASKGRARPVAGVGAAELIENIDEWGAFMLISNNVYLISAVKSYVSAGYQYCYANAPHVAILLMAFKDNPLRFILADKSIILGHAHNPGGGWSLTNYALTRTSLLTLPMSVTHRKVLRQKMMAAVELENHVLVHGLYICKSEGRATAKYYIQKIYEENFQHIFTSKVKYLAWKILSLTPTLAINIIRRIGRDEQLKQVLDRERL